MSKIDNQVIQSMKMDDSTYGERNKKIVMKKDKTQKHKPNFNQMSINDLLNVNEDMINENELELELN